MKKTFLYASLIVLLASILSSCLGDNDVDYTEWKKQNDAYYLQCMDSIKDGKRVYEQIIPSWAPSTSVLVKWHNDRSLTAKELSPLDNSTVYVKYALETIDGTKIQNSYSSTTYGDSIYRTQPSQNIIGFWAALTNMHVGDSVTMVIPASAGYGSSASGSIKPYSTLIYHVKLKSIPAFEIPSSTKK